MRRMVRRAYENGYRAFTEKRSLYDNIYPTYRTDLWEAWRSGWMEAERRAAA